MYFFLPSERWLRAKNGCEEREDFSSTATLTMVLAAWAWENSFYLTSGAICWAFTLSSSCRPVLLAYAAEEKEREVELDDIISEPGRFFLSRLTRPRPPITGKISLRQQLWQWCWLHGLGKTVSTWLLEPFAGHSLCHRAAVLCYLHTQLRKKRGKLSWIYNYNILFTISTNILAKVCYQTFQPCKPGILTAQVAQLRKAVGAAAAIVLIARVKDVTCAAQHRFLLVSTAVIDDIAIFFLECNCCKLYLNVIHTNVLFAKL